MTRRVTAVLSVPLFALLVTGCSDGAGTSAAATATSSLPPLTTTLPSPPAAELSPPAMGTTTFTTLTGTDTRLTLDARFLSTLQTLRVGLAAVKGASIDKAGGTTTFVFPISGGNATVASTGGNPFSGTVQHRGGLKLTALGRSVTIDKLVLDGSSDTLTAEVAGRRVPLLPLSTTDAKVTTGPGTATITDDAVSLSPDAVNALTKGLALPTLPALTFGALKVTLAGS